PWSDFPAGIRFHTASAPFHTTNSVNRLGAKHPSQRAKPTVGPVDELLDERGELDRKLTGS
ncbi:MAG TPA: hypothetical protein VLZ05_06620, partial [Mycobacterium sp.]